MATNELTRVGIDEWKRERLKAAGASVVIPDFTETEKILDFLNI